MKKLLALFMLMASPAFADMGAVPYIPVTNHTVTIASSSAGSVTPTAQGIDNIRIVCTVACYVAIAASGEAVVAATPSGSGGAVTSVYMPANVPEVFRIGSRSKVAVLGVSAGGTLYMTEMSK